MKPSTWFLYLHFLWRFRLLQTQTYVFNQLFGDIFILLHHSDKLFQGLWVLHQLFFDKVIKRVAFLRNRALLYFLAKQSNTYKTFTSWYYILGLFGCRAGLPRVLPMGKQGHHPDCPFVTGPMTLLRSAMRLLKKSKLITNFHCSSYKIQSWIPLQYHLIRSALIHLFRFMDYSLVYLHRTEMYWALLHQLNRDPLWNLLVEKVFSDFALLDKGTHYDTYCENVLRSNGSNYILYLSCVVEILRVPLSTST